MKRLPKSLGVVIVVGLALVAAVGWAAQDVLPGDVQIAPQTLILGANKGGSVVVHAAIGYGLVERGTVTLDGLPAKWTKPDSRGELVAYFGEAQVKGMVDVPGATLTLMGLGLVGLLAVGRRR